jgi:hypothetical protein
MEKFKRITRTLIRVRRLVGRILDRILFVDNYSSTSSDEIRSYEVSVCHTIEEETFLLYGTWSSDSLLKKIEKEFISSIKDHFTVVIVTNSVSVDPWILENNFNYILRNNIGRDLGALRDSLSLFQRLDFSFKAVIWANSSVCWDYSKFIRLYREKILGSLEKFPVMSMTDSFQVQYHLQSYFFVFNSTFLRRLKNDGAQLPFKNFRIKRSVINYGEREFVNWLNSMDLAYTVIFPTKEFASRDFHLYNPALDFYKDLMLRGMPGFKLLPKKGLEDRRASADEIWS